MEHLKHAADRESPLLPRISTECGTASGTAEWDDWKDAAQMSIDVSSFVSAANTDGDWGNSIAKYRKSWDAVLLCRKLASEEKDAGDI